MGWIRGDWQIAAWSLPYLKGMDKRYHRNPLSALSRWKIFDNIRRSLVPFAMILLLISGWTILHDSWFWTLAITVIQRQVFCNWRILPDQGSD